MSKEGIDGKPGNLKIALVEEVLDYENPWIKVFYDRVRFPGGKEGRFTRIASRPGGVVILPVTEDGRICLIHLFRYPLGSWQWELPRGFGEDGVEPLDNAKKELFEELDATTESWELLGTIHSNSGTTSGEVSIFLAKDLPTELAPSKDESIEEFRLLSVTELDQWIAAGKIRDSFTLSAVALARANRVGPWAS